MKKRLLSILLALCMTFTLLPAAAYAEEGVETPDGTPTDVDVTVTAADVQAMIDELPDAESITAENRAEVEGALTAIDDARLSIPDEEELAKIDYTKYEAAVAALSALDGEPGADEPELLEEEKSFFERLKDAEGGTYKLEKDEAITGGMIYFTVTIDLNGYVIEQTAADKRVFLITYYSGSLGNLTIIDSNPTRVHTGKYANLPAGGVITGGKQSGVMIASGASFTMNGGTICNNRGAADAASGGGVRVTQGTFTMNGGTIIDNQAGSAGVVADDVYLAGASSTMYANGGTVGGGSVSNSISVYNHGKITATTSPGTTFNGAVANEYVPGTTNGGIIEAGTYKNTVVNSGTLDGGAYHALVQNDAKISGGAFYGEVENRSTGVIENGIFYGSFRSNIGKIEDSAYVKVQYDLDRNGTISAAEESHSQKVLRGQKITPDTSIVTVPSGSALVGWVRFPSGTAWNPPKDPVIDAMVVQPKFGTDLNASGITVEKNGNLTYNGSLQTQKVTVKYNGTTLTEGTDYTLSSNTGTNATSYTLTITGKGNYSGTRTFSWDIAQKEITQSNATITLAADELTYNGSTQSPTITSITVDGLTLTSADYTLSGDTSGKDAKTYTLTVTGKGNFKGSATKTWKIAQKEITQSNATITLAADELTYNGGTQSPTITSITVDGLTLTSADYTLSGDTSGEDANTDAYVLTVNGKGNFKGSASVNWYINKAELTVTIAQLETLVYNGQAQTATVVTSPHGVALEKNPVKYTYSETEDGTYSESVPSFTTGEHTVYFKAEAKNHEPYAGSFKVKIDKKVVTVTALDRTANTYNYRVPKNPTEGKDYELDGMIEGDTLESVTIKIALEADADVTKSGKYAILVTTEGEDERYAFKYESGTLTVTLRPDFTLEVEKNNGKPGANLTTGTSYKDADKNPNTGLSATEW